MSLICAPSGVNIPSLSEEPCLGDYVSTACVSSPVAITALNLPVNATQQQINNALVLALQYKEEQIAALTLRIEALETP